MKQMVPKSNSKTGPKNDRFLIDFGVPLGVENGAKMDTKRVTKSGVAD